MLKDALVEKLSDSMDPENAADFVDRVLSEARFALRLTDGVAVYVAEAAILWDQSRREAARLRSERASIRCEHEVGAEYDDEGRCTYGGDEPCWRNQDQDQQGRARLEMESQWCQPCRRRQRVHEQYQRAVARRQGLMRSLQRRALAAKEYNENPITRPR